MSTLQPGEAGSWAAPSAAQPEPTPSQSAVVPKEQYTIEEKRCNPSEADCLPEPYNGAEDMIVGRVTGAPYQYRASNKRYPMRERVRKAKVPAKTTETALATRRVSSAFRVFACRRRGNAHSCIWANSTAPCGCVEKRCRWFTQRLTQRVVSSTKDLEMRVGGALVTDRDLLSQAAEFFDRGLADCYYPRKSLLPARHRFVVSLGKYGVAETTVSGSHPSVRKCVFDAIAMDAAPSWISDELLTHGKIRFSGVIEVKMAWVP